jgi:hypothetical protein
MIAASVDTPAHGMLQDIELLSLLVITGSDGNSTSRSMP